MFKNGQLVKTNGYGNGVIIHVSEVAPGRYLLANHGLKWCMWFSHWELTLIGNNFKFKGAK